MFSHKLRYKIQPAQFGKMKNSVSPKTFRQINSLVISLVKGLVLSQNLCQNCVRLSQQFLHCGLGRKELRESEVFSQIKKSRFSEKNDSLYSQMFSRNFLAL